MPHMVVFSDAESRWHEALPIGNGVFGAMAFFCDSTLTFAMNHYEVYYRRLNMYSKAFKESMDRDQLDLSKGFFGYSYEAMLSIGKKGFRDALKEPYFLYGDLFLRSYRSYGREPGGVSHHPTGELAIHPSDLLLEPNRHILKLEIEAARLSFDIEKGDRRLAIRAFVSRKQDCLITEIRQSEAGLVKGLTMRYPARRLLESEVTFSSLSDSAFCYTCEIFPDGEDRDRHGPFGFIVMTKIVGAKGSASVLRDGLEIRILESEKEWRIITTVVTEEETVELQEAARDRIERVIVGVDGVKAEHEEHWKDFWSRSSLSIPDKFLEDLWYINLYSLAASNGRGGRMYHQACGLNGLWDIRQPTPWGSMWYWDVNIQASFWPMYTANRLDLAEAFIEAFFSYMEIAERSAEDFHGIRESFAMDYPFTFYLCIWPWCAQFLWWYYKYSMDAGFLKGRAYPLFRGVLKFVESYAQYDKEKGLFFFFPDISPEQGPLARNSTITLATVRFLLEIALVSNIILDEDECDYTRWKALLGKLAPYPTVSSPGYGRMLRDSEYAPAALRLRHPSLLMPIYPIGEMSRESEDGVRELAENTLRYAEENTEYGTFQFGWLSCAASRLGKGDTAIRLLYEKGIDLGLRPNGLMAEETERWINYCDLMNGPLYYPPMSEASGELVAAINEMLLQSFNGVIRVFPSIPSGAPEPYRTVGMAEHVIPERIPLYPKWSDCGFSRFLTEGAFEVSASMRGGEVRWVLLHSLAGCRAAIRNPFDPREAEVLAIAGGSEERIDFSVDRNVLRFPTEKGFEYLLRALGGREADDIPHPMAAGSSEDIPDIPKLRVAHTKRRVFLGKDRDSDYKRLLDDFTYDFYAGNCRESKVPVYRLDFGADTEVARKDYSSALPRHVHIEGPIAQDFRRIGVGSAFTAYAGLGWDSCEGLRCADRGRPDELRRDFIYGRNERTFILELTRGRYDVLLVAGDQDEGSYTEVETEGLSVRRPVRPLKAGEFMTEILPIQQREDGYLKIAIRSSGGHAWKVNLMIVNKLHCSH